MFDNVQLITTLTMISSLSLSKLYIAFCDSELVFDSMFSTSPSSSCIHFKMYEVAKDSV